MSDSGNASKPSAPLISMRRSYQMPHSYILLLGIGMWLVVGLFSLLHDATLLAQGSVGWAYFVVAGLSLPTVLSYVELRSWIGYSGGVYRLIRAVERNNLTFFAGWAYILGWLGISALIIHTLARYTADLLLLAVGISIPLLIIVIVALLFFVVLNIVGYRLPWRTGVWVVSLTMAGTLLLIILYTVRLTDGVASRTLTAASSGSFFRAILILIASLWVIELAAEMGDRRRRGFSTASLLQLGGPLLAGTLAFLGVLLVAVPFSPIELADNLFPGLGAPIALGIGILAAGASWQILSLVMLRRFQLIGLDGWIPSAFLRPYTRFETPVLLIITQGLITLLGVLIGMGFSNLANGDISTTHYLAAIAAMMLLVIHIGVNAAAGLLGNHPRAQDRPFRLPLHPIIPATGAAINFLLLFALPLPVFLIGVAWFAIGLIIYWQVGLERMRSSQLGVTVFQDVTRRSDLKSGFPVVVPVANPNTADHLVAVGAMIARHYGGHVTIVQIVLVPDQHPLDVGRTRAEQKLDLLERALQKAESYDVPVEGVTRLARNVPQGILDTVAEESARLVIMGWNARGIGTGRSGLGHILDEVLENAPCDVIVVRGDWEQPVQSAIVPVAGGPHAPRAAEFALALTAGTNGEVTLLNVARESDGQSAVEAGERVVLETQKGLSEPSRVIPTVVRAAAPLSGIIQEAEKHDAVFLGATEQALIDRQLFGQLPLKIAEETDMLLALVRSYTGLGKLVARKAWASLDDLMPTLTSDDQMEVYHQLRRSARPNINYFVLIAASAIIATLGLLLNSPAVIIGAMLVAPLMSPFVSAGMGIVSGDIQMLRNALTSILQGVLLSVFLAILATLLSPLANVTTEVLARTQPNLLDLMIALVSGVAGGYAIARKEVGAALPGVAIAAALMPPICSIGIGIALGQAAVALGATLLFTTNLVAIIFATAITFLLLGMRPPQRPDRQRWLRQGLTISVVLLLLISIPLGIVLFRAVERDRVEGLAQDVVQQEISEWEQALEDQGEVSLVEMEVVVDWRQVRITGTLFTTTDISSADIRALDARLERELARPVDVDLFAIQGTRLDSQPDSR